MKVRQEHKHKRWTAIHYNAIAKEIRDVFPTDYRGSCVISQRTTLSLLALNLARRFQKDSDEAAEGYVFDPIKFLNACSPDTQIYPLGELWQDFVIPKCRRQSRVDS